ncbi:MAG: hypothetical protein LC722_08970 [Actinobacteria bacterium]|nr:hypothetical protein [Actinomycetota bacterium]
MVAEREGGPGSTGPLVAGERDSDRHELPAVGRLSGPVDVGLPLRRLAALPGHAAVEWLLQEQGGDPELDVGGAALPRHGDGLDDLPGQLGPAPSKGLRDVVQPLHRRA